MSKWKVYRRMGLAEMRPYVIGENMLRISVAAVDVPPEVGGMIARNPQNHEDQWYVAEQYFKDNFEEISARED